MSKKPLATSKRARTSAQPSLVVDLSTVEVKPSLLMFVDLDRQPKPEEHDQQEEKLNYFATIEEISTDKKFTTATCHLFANYDVDDVSVFAVSTHYVVGFLSKSRLDEDTKRRIVRDLVNVSVWPRFGDLLSLLAAQGGAEFPLLPSRPNITWPEELQEGSPESQEG